MSSLEIELAKAKLVKQRERLEYCLPHLYGFKHYKWSREFYESTNRLNFLCAGNQLSKSSASIRKAIHWATEPSLWPKLWSTKPNTFWYMYPSREVATIEATQKFVKEFLPREEMKEHKQYGWELERRDRWVWAIHFKTGVTMFFKTYRQDPQMLQAGTAWAIFCFTAGHKVITKDGVKNIEDLAVGDLVRTRDGYHPITVFSSHVDDVTQVEFANGESLTGTKDHPVMTKHGWKALGELTVGTLVYKYPPWSLLKSWLFLREYFTGAIRTIRTSGTKTFLGEPTTPHCTSVFGRLAIKARCQRVTAYITRILTRSTIALRISNFLLAQSITAFTNSTCGKKDRVNRSPVMNVVSGLWHKAISLLHDAIVATAVKNPPTTTSASTVYTVTVASQPEYFCNGILVHNCDEEMDWSLFPEVSRRIAATRGYFSLVFTATLGQVTLKDIIEGTGNRRMFPDAARWQVSMYDCMFYEDGSPSIWTKERIEEEIRAIGDPREVDRRVHGKFVLSSGLKYPGFTIDRNLKPPLSLVTYQSWHLYAGVDLGSGSARGSENVAGHPAAITFVAIRPDFKYGRVFRGWIGLEVETSAGDVYNQYLEMSKDLNMVQQFYDYAAKDFLLIAQRAGTAFEAAEKGIDSGEMVLNTLFKNGMMDVDDIPELQPLVRELISLSKGKKKNDDFTDSLRYCVVRIAWNFTALRDLFDLAPKQPAAKIETSSERLNREREESRKSMLGDDSELNQIYEDEIEAWNELYDT